MAKYDTRVAALALAVEEAWLSSILTRFQLSGIVRGRQGFRRQLSAESVVLLAIIRTLIAEMGVSAAAAVTLAHDIVSSPAGLVEFEGGAARLTYDLTGTRRRVRAALDDAVARSTEVRRGRPRSRTLSVGRDAQSR